MSTEPDGEKQDQEAKQEEGAKEEPQVFAVQKDLTGWRFNRRDFLAAAGAATAAATMAGCGAQPEQATAPAPATPTKMMLLTKTPTPTKVPTDTPVPTNTSTPTKTPTRTPTRTPTKTPTPQPIAIVNNKELNVRYGPGVNYDILGVVKQGDKLSITGRLADKSWYQVDYNDQVGWVYGEMIIAENADDVPVIADIPPTNTPAATPTPVATPTPPGVQGTVAPGQEGIEYTFTNENGEVVTYTMPCGTPIPEGAVCVCNCVTAELPGQAGSTPPDQEGINFTGPGGETRWAACGSPIPDGWTCSCNCVAPICSCVGHCSCDGQGGHYWYPC